MAKKKKKNKKKYNSQKVAKGAQKKAKVTQNKKTTHKSVKKGSLKQAAPSSKSKAKKGATKKTTVPKKKSQKTEKPFAKKLEEVIEQSETKKSPLGDKIIVIGDSAKEITKKWKGFWKKFTGRVIKVLIAVIVLCAIAGGIIAIESFSHDRVLPRVAVSKMDYSFMPITEAKNNISSRFGNFQQQSFIFTLEDKQVAIPLNTLGINLLIEETIDSVPYFQFTQDNYLSLLASAIMDRDIVPLYKKDDKKIFKLIEEKIGLKSKRAQSAQLRQTEAGTIIMVPEQKGIIINQAKLQKNILNRIYQLNIKEIPIETLRELPQVTTQELKENLTDLQVKLENEITIKHKEQEWAFHPMDHIEWIRFRKNNDEIIITVTQELLDHAFQEGVFSQTEIEVSNLHIYYNEEGEIIFDGKAINGEEVNKNKLINDLEMAINSLDTEVTLEVNKKIAAIEIDPELQEFGIESLLGTGHTTFSGSPSNRRHNIATGMARFNGLLIKPGEIFSFNENLGEVDGSTGYKLELVIKAEGTVPEYGGGICQVSSTMYKAGLFAGLPIVERSPHSYAVSYYAQIDGYGLDSTIYPGVKDLQLENDTPGHILIQTFVEGDHAYINFFGKSDGREVKIENYWRGNWRGAGGTQYIPTKTLPPGVKKQIESAHSGFDASWDRIITKDGEETVEKIYSVYRATANRILVGEGAGGGEEG